PHSVPLKITGQKPAEAYRKAVAGPRQSPLKIAETKRPDRSGESHERAAKLSVRRPRRKRRKRIKGPSLDPDSRGHFCPRLIGVKRKIDQKQERPSSRPMPVFPTSNLNSALRWDRAGRSKLWSACAAGRGWQARPRRAGVSAQRRGVHRVRRGIARVACASRLAGTCAESAAR